MIKTSVYKCPKCKAIVILQDTFLTVAHCNICKNNMIMLDDDFDLAEIIQCDSCKNETGEIEEP